MAHYAYSQEPNALMDAGIALVEDLTEELGDRKFALVYTGMSGVSIATVMSTLMRERYKQFRMIYVRKQDEESYGSKIETPLGWTKFSKKKQFTLVFVDDFRQTGSTRCFAMRQVLEKMDNVDEDTPVFSLFTGQSRHNDRFDYSSRLNEDYLKPTTLGTYRNHFVDCA